MPRDGVEPLKPERLSLIYLDLKILKLIYYIQKIKRKENGTHRHFSKHFSSTGKQ